MQLVAGKAISVAMVAGASIVAVVTLSILIFVGLPASVASHAEARLEIPVTAIVLLAVGWAGVSSLIAGYEIRRLSRPCRWRLDYPFAPWRTVKSAFLAVGWAASLSFYPLAVLDNALLPGFEVAPRPNTPVLAVGFGVLLLALGLIMALVDVICRRVHHGQR